VEQRLVPVVQINNGSQVDLSGARRERSIRIKRAHRKRRVALRTRFNSAEGNSKKSAGFASHSDRREEKKKKK